jgi:hypothetical protein
MKYHLYLRNDKKKTLFTIGIATLFSIVVYGQNNVLNVLRKKRGAMENSPEVGI